MTTQGGTRARVVSSAVALCVRSAWERAATLLAMLVVARLLSPADLGQAALVIAGGGLAATLVDAGVTTSLVRQPGEPSAGQLAAARTLQLGTSGALVLLAAGAALAGAPLGALALLTCLKLPCRPATLRARVHLQRGLDFRGLAVADGAGLLVQALAAVGLAAAVGGPGALVGADLLGGLTTAGWVVLRLGARLPAAPVTPEPATPRSVLRASLPCSGFALVSAGRDLATSLFVGALLGVRELGLLQFAYRVLTPVLVVFAAVGQLSVPLGRAVLAGDRSAREQVRDGFLLSGLAAALVLGAVAASARWLVPLAFGAGWEPAVPLVVAVALALVVSGPLNYLGLGLLVAAGRVATASAVVVGSAAVFAASLLVLPVRGAGGGAVAWLVMAVVEAAAVAAACSRLGLHLARVSVLPPLVFAAALGVGAAAGASTGGTGLVPAVAAAAGATATAAVLSWALASRQLLSLLAVRRPAPALVEVPA